MLHVPAAVSGSATGECGLLLQHFHHRINVAVVTLLSLQYLLPAGFVLVGLKNNNNKDDNVYGAVIVAKPL